MQVRSRKPVDMLTAEERAALESIRETYPLLEEWRVRSWRAEVPQVGSELDLDDRIAPWNPVSEYARQSLVSATQHLNMARTALEASQIYPNAHYTVLRGALVGGSVAVWMLAPDDRHPRQQRGLRVAYEWMHRAGQYYKDLVPIAGDELPDLGAARERLTLRQGEVRALWQGANGLGADEPLSVTKAVASAASVVFPEEAAKVSLLWREMSGDAHALGWPMLVRSTDVTHLGGGMGELRAGGDLERLRNAFRVCWRITKRGWSLFDQRCETA